MYSFEEHYLLLLNPAINKQYIEKKGLWSLDQKTVRFALNISVIHVVRYCQTFSLEPIWSVNVLSNKPMRGVHARWRYFIECLFGV